MIDDRLDLSSVPRELPPPPGIDRRIAAALRRERGVRRVPLIAYALAAVAAIAIAIFVYQRPAPVVQPGYILLLYESPQFTGGSRAEYSRWAKEMRPSVVGGEELGMRDVAALAGTVTPLPTGSSRLAGYFLLSAADDTRASDIARACPHLTHGGAVVLRKIVQ
jgi:hypothetical protein